MYAWIKATGLENTQTQFNAPSSTFDPTPFRSSRDEIVARPGPIAESVVRRFTRGTEEPRGIVWFGATSFWGHLRHLFTAAVADREHRLPRLDDAGRAARLAVAHRGVLGGDSKATTLTEALGRDLYLDFVADTGDDVAVSRAVARLVFAPYELPNPDQPGVFLLAPRGDILLFGGDTAYPVATAEELMNRVIAPWNQVLQSLPDDDGRRRVLLGVPAITTGTTASMDSAGCSADAPLGRFRVLASR